MILVVPFYTSTSIVHDLTDVQLLDEFLESITSIFFSRIESMKNPEVLALLD